jgi:uncharacterized protein
MLLDLSRLGARDRVERTFAPEAFQPSEDFAIRAPVRLEVDIVNEKDDYRLAGRVTTTLELGCVRCLEPFQLPIDAAFDLRYQPFEANTGEGEREIQADDLESAFYKDESIDLEQLMREQFYLALPMKPLCVPECKGLCPQCGANLNQTTCSCAPEWQDPRLAGLRRLLDQQ